jgi:hypothetical protein
VTVGLKQASRYVPLGGRSRYKTRTAPWSRYDSAEQALEAYLPSPVKVAALARLRNLPIRHSEDSVMFRKAMLRYPDNRLGGMLTIKAYASDRLTICASRECVPGGNSHRRRRSIGARWRSVAALVKHPESRRQVRIGGRWRSKPRETKFTTAAARLVEDGAHLIEKDYGGKAVFLTLTFPGRSDECKEIYQEASGYVVDRFNRWLRYKASGGLFCYVWERHKNGWPHLHYLFATNGAADINLISQMCANEWHRIMLDLCAQTRVDVFQRRGGGSWLGDSRFPRVDARFTVGGLGQYLSKYCAKSRSKVSSGGGFFPGRWAGISYPLRALVFASRIKVSVRFGDERSAKNFAAHSLRFAGTLLADQWIANPVKTHGAFVCCMNVPVGRGIDVAKALESWALDGDATAIIDLIREFCTPLPARAAPSDRRVTYGSRPPDSEAIRGTVRND